MRTDATYGSGTIPIVFWNPRVIDLSLLPTATLVPVGMSHPERGPLSASAEHDIDKIRSTMITLCDMWDAGVHDRQVEYRGELDAARAVAIRTHAHHTVRLARAVLRLDDTAGGIEVIPLVRLMLECAVMAGWGPSCRSPYDVRLIEERRVVRL